MKYTIRWNLFNHEFLLYMLYKQREKAGLVGVLEKNFQNHISGFVADFAGFTHIYVYARWIITHESAKIQSPRLPPHCLVRFLFFFFVFPRARIVDDLVLAMVSRIRRATFACIYIQERGGKVGGCRDLGRRRKAFETENGEIFATGGVMLIRWLQLRSLRRVNWPGL